MREIRGIVIVNFFLYNLCLKIIMEFNAPMKPPIMHKNIRTFSAILYLLLMAFLLSIRKARKVIKFIVKKYILNITSPKIIVP